MTAVAWLTGSRYEGNRPNTETIKETERMMTTDASAGFETRRRTRAQIALVSAVASLLIGLLTASSAAAAFKIASLEGSLTDQSGYAFTKAGGHPFAFTTSFSFNTDSKGDAVENVKDIEVELPPGFIGDPSATPKCTYSEVTQAPPECPASTQVGTLTLTVGSFGGGTEAVYNMVPSANEPAELAVPVPGIALIVIQTRVRTGSDYGVTAFLPNISTAAPITASSLTLWGVPADAKHNAERFCAGSYGPGCSTSAPLTPFFTLPTACQGPQVTTLHSDSWQAIGEWQTASVVTEDESGNPIGMEGCEKLDFSPSMTLTPTTSAADSPSGLEVDLHMPQNESSTGLAEADLKDATVTLPTGITVNPAAANGLTACTPEEIGMENEDQPTCPDSSKIGSVSVVTPLLVQPLTGGVYVAEQENNPFKSLLAVYVTAKADGTLVKLAGHVVANAVTGQLETTFSENPQLPFSDLKLHFFGGPGAVLATPQTCGLYAGSASFASWAEPENAVDQQLRPFEVTSGPGGAVCGTSSFAPAFEAGTVDNQAAGYSPLVMTLNRKDGEQRFGSVAFKMPPGLVGMVSHVTPCPEVEANAGTCPAASQIGHVSVAAGVGGQLDTLPEPGRQEDPVYLTQSYKGAPFGIAVVVHAEAGPFNLGTVVVRGTINVDPRIAQVSIATDASGPYAMPTMLRGIPVDVKSINIEVNKSEFMLNPTSCEPMRVTGTIGSAEGASANVSSRFQVANCASLAFKPTFTASTKAKHTRKEGASLNVKVTSGSGQANIAKVHVELPKVLPSRLSTLQKACTEAAFNANPASCPAASIVGHAIAHTPILPVPLEGPAYFVSHGNQKFPELILVLQGYGITIDLEGETFISKAGVTSSTFAHVPDAPVSSFDLVLPEGPNSALTGHGNLCNQKLTMPTEFVGQNGATLNQKTQISVEGCSNAASIVSKKISGKTITLKVAVPAKGKLKASGKGLSSVTKSSSGRETLTLVLHQKHGEKLKTKIKLSFKPSKGKCLSKRLAVSFSK